MPNKVVVIGLDGATFDLLEPWIETGRLPTFQRLLQSGTAGRLASVVPPLTPSAWASFMTGKNPGKHGIYYFVGKDRVTGREVPVNAALRAGKTLFELLSEAGRTVVVLNVPTTYPPQRVNGVMISDFLTPKGRRDFTFPPTLADELEAKFGPYPLYLRTPLFSANISDATIEAFLAELHEEVGAKFAIAHHLMDRYEPDFAMLHLWGTDRVQHELWNLIDPQHPQYDRHLADKYGERIVQYFQAIDSQLHELRARMDQDSTLLVMSDHGFGPVHTLIDLNVWLLEQGYIAIKSTPMAQLRYLAWRSGVTYTTLAKILRHAMKWGLRLPEQAPLDGVRMVQTGRRQALLSLNDVDWSRTQAFCKPGLGQITINLRGRDPYGCVGPGAEYARVREEIVAKLRDLRNPWTGDKVGGVILTRDELYHGPYVDEAPDITFLPMDDNYLAGSILGFMTRHSITRDPFIFLLGCVGFGHHRMDGILLAEGPQIPQGKRITGATILDLAPTILHLMGEGVPQDMDGKVLENLFTEQFMRGNPILLTAPGGEGNVQASGMSEAEEEDLIDRLRGLGYL
jgi:predicted AlkP superfamily phosphohydrolase/phosphomutase